MPNAKQLARDSLDVQGRTNERPGDGDDPNHERGENDVVEHLKHVDFIGTAGVPLEPTERESDQTCKTSVVILA